MQVEYDSYWINILQLEFKIITAIISPCNVINVHMYVHMYWRPSPTLIISRKYAQLELDFLLCTNVFLSPYSKQTPETRFLQTYRISYQAF